MVFRDFIPFRVESRKKPVNLPKMIVHISIKLNKDNLTGLSSVLEVGF